jgi:hypothetical protein
VDALNWFLIDVLRHRLKKGCDAELEVTEMLPDPTQLWLKDADGSHTSELRLTCFAGRESGKIA